MQDNIVIEIPDINLETALLKGMSYKDNYQKYYDSIDKKRLLPPTANLLYDYEKYFKLFPEHETIDWELFYTQFSQSWHLDLDEQSFRDFKDFTLPAILNNTEQDVAACLVGIIKKTFGDQISQLIASNKLDEAKELFDTYEKKIHEYTNSTKKALRMSEIDESVLDKTKGISWFLPSLQESLGSLVRGQLIVVNAGVGAGKSAFVVSQAAHTLGYLVNRQLDNPILYFNSEGTSADVIYRVCSNLYKEVYTDGFEEVVAKSNEVKEKFIPKFNELFYVFQMDNISLKDVRSEINVYTPPPSLIIIDMADSLVDDVNWALLKKLYDNLRSMSNVLCPIIATTQAANTSWRDGEGHTHEKKWLKTNETHGSKVDKGGAADTMIAIGKDDINKELRYISTPKKKRGKEVALTCILEEKYSLFKELSW